MFSSGKNQFTLIIKVCKRLFIFAYSHKIRFFCFFNFDKNDSLKIYPIVVILLNALRWHWLRLYRLQVYIIMIHDLYMVLCPNHSKSNYLPPPYILFLITIIWKKVWLNTLVCIYWVCVLLNYDLFSIWEENCPYFF